MKILIFALSKRVLVTVSDDCMNILNMLKIPWHRVLAKSEPHSFINLTTSYHSAVDQVAARSRRELLILMGWLLWCRLDWICSVRVQIRWVYQNHRVLKLRGFYLILRRVEVFLIYLISISLEVVELLRWILMVWMMLWRLTTLIYDLDLFPSVCLLNQTFKTVLLSHHLIAFGVVLIEWGCRIIRTKRFLVRSLSLVCASRKHEGSRQRTLLGAISDRLGPQVGFLEIYSHRRCILLLLVLLLYLWNFLMEKLRMWQLLWLLSILFKWVQRCSSPTCKRKRH